MILKRIEKINLILICLGLIVLSCFTIYIGITNLVKENYTSLGDPYYTNQILAFKRAPLLIWTTIEIIVLITIQLIILIIKKIWSRSSK